MSMLEDAVLRDRYDVVVVGAGMGGLTAAALLAKRGLHVLVLEQHYVPGGCCTAIRRRDVTMDVAAAMLFGFGEQGYNPMRFVMNELEEPIDMIPHESIYRMHLEGRQVTFWRDMDRFLDEMGAAFPHQDTAIRKAYAELKTFYDTMMMTNQIPVPPTEVPLWEGMKSFLKHPLGTLRLVGYMLKSSEDVLKKYITDPKVIGLFDFLTATYTCCHTGESPALLGATMFIDNHVGGACYPSGSPQMLPNKLEKAIEKHGGQLVYRRTVERILVWQNRAYGVRLADGTEILADHVISNATVWNLYGKLVGPRHIKPKRMQWAQSFEPTIGVVMLYMSVNEAAIPEGTRPIEMLVENAQAMNGANYVVFIPSLDDPSIAPPGKHSMSAICPAVIQWPALDDPFYQSDAYYRRKEEVAEKALDDLERMYFPRLRENILTLDVGTPATFERYTLRNFGCVGGPKLTLKQNFFSRLKARSDWKNLYCVGDSTSMGEGVIAATVSGVGAANRLLEDVGLPIYLYRPFPKQYVNLVRGKPWTPPPEPAEAITAANAPRAARECQHCETPECRKACPAGIDTCLFARRIEAGNFTGAARVLREVNPLSEVCGWVCPSERLCEKQCNRREFSVAPVRIRELHGWVCAHLSPLDGWDRHVGPPTGKQVAVIGAGPAGLTAAHYLARMGHRVDIMDKSDRPGGMLTQAIPVSRLPDEVVRREIRGLTLPGMNFLHGRTLGKNLLLQELEGLYDAVFLAPGLGAGRTLRLPGRPKSVKVSDALKLLQAWRQAGRVKTAEEVIVIGGGSVAADAAVMAGETGARKVTLVCLEQRAQMPCLPPEVEALETRGVTIQAGWGPQAFTSENQLTFVRCTSVFDEAGRFAPTYDAGRTLTVDCGQVILAVGQAVEPSLARYLKEEFHAGPLIQVDPETLAVPNRPGVYAGGDITRGAGTVVEAVADGRRAAAAIDVALRRPRHGDATTAIRSRSLQGSGEILPAEEVNPCT